MVIPEIARKRLALLNAAYVLSKRDLSLFAEGLVLGMGLSPDDWEINTRSMTLTPQSNDGVESQNATNSVTSILDKLKVVAGFAESKVPEVGTNGPENQW